MPNKKQDLLKSEYSPLSIARMLWKRRFVALAVCFVLSAVTAAVVYQLPAVYMSQATVLVDTQKIPEKYVTSTVNTEVGDRLATINQQIMSTSRLIKIIENFDLYKDERKKKTQEEIIEQMRKDIAIDLIKGWTGGRPGAFKVGYQGPNPTIVASVANQLANLYVEENLKTRETQAEGTADFLDSQLERAKKTLDELEVKVSEFKRAHTGSLPEQQNSLISSLSNWQVQLQGIQDATNRAQQNKVMLETAMSAAIASESLLARSLQARTASNPTGFNPGNSSPAGVPAGPKRSELMQQRLDQLLLQFKDGHPDVAITRAEINRLKRQEEAEEKQSAQTRANELAAAAKLAEAEKAAESAAKNNEKSASQPKEVVTKELLQERERIATLRSQLANTMKELESRSAERDQVVKLMSSYQARVDRLPIVEQQMASLTRDYEMSKANYKSLLDKKLAAGMATDMERRQQGERFTIIDPARVPEKPFKPNRILLGGIGIALSIALGLILGIALEIRKNALLGEWELPADMVVLARVPKIEMPVAGRNWSLATPARIGSVAVLTIVVLASAYYAWGRF